MTDKPVERLKLLINGAESQLRANTGSGRIFLLIDPDPDTAMEIRKFQLKVVSSPDGNYDGDHMKSLGWSTKGLHMVSHPIWLDEGQASVEVTYPVKPNEILSMARDLYRLEKGEKISLDAAADANGGKYKIEIERRR